MTTTTTRRSAPIPPFPLEPPEIGPCMGCHQQRMLTWVVRQRTRNPVVTRLDWHVCSLACAEAWQARLRRAQRPVER